MKWFIFTGDNPSCLGAMGDYSARVCAELGRRGERAVIFAAPCVGIDQRFQGLVEVRRLPDHFSFRSFKFIDMALRKEEGQYRILVQYVPHAFGLKAMNVFFCLWIAFRYYGKVRVMFHEVAYPLSWQQPCKHNILGFVTRGMAWLLMFSAAEAFFSVDDWRKLFPGRLLKGKKTAVLPVPSVIPVASRLEAVSFRRDEMLCGCAHLVGHFGTYGPLVRPILCDALESLLASNAAVRIVLVGVRSDGFCADFVALHPEWNRRLLASGNVSGQDAADYLAACDLLLQPYPDGVSGRRTTTMTGLALGVPVVTNRGARTEDFWEEQDIVELARTSEGSELAELCDKILRDKERRDRLSANGKKAYGKFFCVERAVDVMMGSAAGENQ